MEESESTFRAKVTFDVVTKYRNPRNAEALWEDHLSDAVMNATQMVACQSREASEGALTVEAWLKFDDVHQARQHLDEEIVPLIVSFAAPDSDDMDDPHDAEDAGQLPVISVTAGEVEMTEA